LEKQLGFFLWHFLCSFQKMKIEHQGPTRPNFRSKTINGVVLRGQHIVITNEKGVSSVIDPKEVHAYIVVLILKEWQRRKAMMRS